MKLKCPKCKSTIEVNIGQLMGKVKTEKKIKSYTENFKNRWKKK